jgi:DNA-binding NarL/FixJ family response regulator
VFDPAIVRLLVAGVSSSGSPVDELTARERHILGEMAQGKSNAAIAEGLVLTKTAIEKHIGSIS